jgi:hypothetical protein
MGNTVGKAGTEKTFIYTIAEFIGENAAMLL